MTQMTDLQGLVDRFELTELISRLGRWLDDPASADAADLLSDDATVTSPGGTATGLAAVAAQARRTHDRQVTQHVMTDVLVDPQVGADDATLTANLLVTFVGEDEPRPAWRSGARYRFGARRTDAGWRLTAIHVEPVWQEGTRPVVAG